MRAAGATELPDPARRDHGLEVKFDGWRCIAFVTRDGVELQSRHLRSLSRYFPDVRSALADHVAPNVILDGELLVWDENAGRTSFALLQRRVTAGRGLTREAAAHPAHFVSFDLLQDARGRELLDQPLSTRRRRLERLLASAPSQLPICPQTTDDKLARVWFEDLSVTGADADLRPSEVAVRLPDSPPP
jgi:ATP-dependent DNA ligase